MPGHVEVLGQADGSQIAVDLWYAWARLARAIHDLNVRVRHGAGCLYPSPRGVDCAGRAAQSRTLAKHHAF